MINFDYINEKDDEAMVCRVVMMGDRAEEVLALREIVGAPDGN